VTINLNAQNSWDGHNVDTLSGISNAIGSAFNDTFYGTTGDNTFTGLGGADSFAFSPSFGHDTIADFSEGQGDTITFYGSIFANYADMTSHAAQSGSNVVITDTGGDTLTLLNTTLAGLHSSDFVFA
jgi:Ca2+-binding RTX toxin-like protein